MINSMYVGDLHGRIRSFELAIEKFEKEGLDMLVFMGDYVDSYNLTNTEILYLLDQVIRYKKENPNKVICLLGNHDMQYIYSPDYRCSGFRPEILHDIQFRFMHDRNLFQVAWLNGKWMATHAGILNNWLYRYNDRLEYWADKFGIDVVNEYDQLLNAIHEKTSDGWILNTVGQLRGCRSGIGGITWADSTEIEKQGCFYKYNHIVGHNRVDEIKKVMHKDGNTIVFTDCLGKKDDFFILKN